MLSYPILKLPMSLPNQNRIHNKNIKTYTYITCLQRWRIDDSKKTEAGAKAKLWGLGVRSYRVTLAMRVLRLTLVRG